VTRVRLEPSFAFPRSQSDCEFAIRNTLVTVYALAAECSYRGRRPSGCGDLHKHVQEVHIEYRDPTNSFALATLDTGNRAPAITPQLRSV
jgi:hypothetical protein